MSELSDRLIIKLVSVLHEKVFFRRYYPIVDDILNSEDPVNKISGLEKEVNINRNTLYQCIAHSLLEKKDLSQEKYIFLMTYILNETTNNHRLFIDELKNRMIDLSVNNSIKEGIVNDLYLKHIPKCYPCSIKLNEILELKGTIKVKGPEIFK